MSTFIKTTILATCLIAVSAAPSLADRDPTPEERTRIENALRSEGFVRWDDIELDDNVWEVDDARNSAGQKFDLELDPATMRILKRDADD